MTSDRVRTRRIIVFKQGCLLFFLALCHVASAWSMSPKEPDSYELGLEQKDRGNWQTALQTWLAASDSLQKQDVSDPRIGMAFIQLVTEQKATDYYQQASKIYFRGFSHFDLHVFKEAIGVEIERIRPLLTNTEGEGWRDLLEREDSALGREITSFWIRKDPIPTTEINERLIEHWERIAYMRANLNLDETTVYGTDDRGLVFIKYGVPERKYSGKLGIDQFEIMRWFDDFLLRQEIQRFNNMPDFELWLYDNLRKGSTTPFLFGKKAGFGKYGLRYGLEDLIPERAFRRRSSKTTTGILPGAILQLMYYRELINVDKFYSERYRELESLWINARATGRQSPSYDVIRGLVSHYHSVDKFTAEFKYLPEDRTDAFEGLEKLYLNHKLFRYLDRQRQPALSVTIVSSDEPIDKDFGERFFKRAEKTRFKNRHVLIIHNENQRMLDPILNYPDVHGYNTSVFTVEHDPLFMYTVTAEKVILDVRKAELQESDLPDTAKVIGIRSVVLDAEPLVAGFEVFEVSDAIVGTAALPDLADSGIYPFKTMPVDPVKSSSVQVYWQFYNLKLNSKGKGKLRVEYQLQAIRKKGKVDKKTEFLKRTFEHEFATRDGDYLFTVDISRLKPARYELILKVTDRQAKTKRVRKTRFRIAG